MLGITVAFAVLFAQSDESRFAEFCRDHRLAESICADSPNGDNDLADCIFDRTRSVRQCAQILHTDTTTLKKIRSRRENFIIDGRPWGGFYLGVSEKHAQEMSPSPYDWYAGIIRTQKKLLAGEAELRSSAFLAESDRRAAERKEPFQWGGASRRKISTEQVNVLRVQYALLIENARQRAKRRDVVDYLRKERNRILPQLENVSAWREAQRLKQIATALVDEARASSSMSGWGAVTFFSIDSCGNAGRIEVFIEDRKHTKITEWLDNRVRIFPWLKLAIAAYPPNRDSSLAARTAPPECTQPSLDPEPEFDQKKYALIQQGNVYLLFTQTERLREFDWSDEDIARLNRMLVIKLSVLENDGERR